MNFDFNVVWHRTVPYLYRNKFRGTKTCCARPACLLATTERACVCVCVRDVHENTQSSFISAERERVKCARVRQHTPACLHASIIRSGRTEQLHSSSRRPGPVAGAIVSRLLRTTNNNQSCDSGGRLVGGAELFSGRLTCASLPNCTTYITFIM